ncbi:MAG: AAA family ATPase [Lysobacterales bacterium]
MAHLLGIRIQNFRALRNVTLGKIEYDQKTVELPRLVCLIGPNGSGKSTMLDAFGFLSDCLREGVEVACDKPHRGGFDVIRTQGATEPISFQLYFRQSPTSRPITYELQIGVSDGRPVVLVENLKQRRKGQGKGRPFPFLKLQSGIGEAWSGEATEGEEVSSRVPVSLDDPARLGITTLGQLREHPRILGLRAYVEGWYLSYFVPDAARSLQISGAQRHLDRTGANIGNYLQHLKRRPDGVLDRILESLSQKIPGITRIDCKDSDDRRLLIQFNERGYDDPFYQSSMSDGTLKYLAYLLLLEDPEPHPLIGIEEPENGLYYRLLRDLADEFQNQARSGNRTQVFVTTHAPAFVDALAPESVWLFQRDDAGGVEATRVADIPSIKALYEEGVPLGSLWFSHHFNEHGFEGA